MYMKLPITECQIAMIKFYPNIPNLSAHQKHIWGHLDLHVSSPTSSCSSQAPSLSAPPSLSSSSSLPPNHWLLPASMWMDRKYLASIYGTFYHKTKEYTFFSASQGTFSKIYHIIGHKTGFNRCKNIEIIPSILLDDHRQRLVFNNNNKQWKAHIPMETEYHSTQW